MKIFFSTVLLFLFCGFANAQGTWTQKAYFGGSSRQGAVGFSIGGKGYIGTGSYGSGLLTYLQDFWEYDPVLNTWTQKANFGGGARFGAVGFSIGTKGYIGLGGNSNDFWEWNRATNVWTPKANFPGNGKFLAVGFSIGSKGYIGTGTDNITYYYDFWEWNQTTDTWIQKTNFGGSNRAIAVAFSIGTKGYISTGTNASTHPLGKNDLWEWDPSTNIWTQKANFGGIARTEAFGFSIGNYGYIGTGTSYISTGSVSDFWAYNSITNTWTQKANYGGGIKEMAVGFSIGCKGYAGTGYVNDNWGTCSNDFWEFAPDTCVGVGIDETNTKNLFSIFPNPSNGIFTIQANSQEQIANSQLEIYNSLGEKIHSQKIISEKTEIDLSQEVNGIYFVSVKTGKEIFTEKIIIKK